MNKGAPWAAFSEARIDDERPYPQKLTEQERRERCCHSPNPLYSSAWNYFSIRGLPANLLTATDRPIIEDKMLRQLKGEAEEAEVLAALQRSTHYLRGLRIWTQEDYPISGVLAEVTSFPVEAVFAGRMADGSMGDSQPTMRTRTFEIATLVPPEDERKRPNYFLLYSKFDAVNEIFVEILAPRFQPAANLISGALAGSVATIGVILLAGLWIGVWRVPRPISEAAAAPARDEVVDNSAGDGNANRT